MKNGTVYSKLCHDSPGEPENSRFGASEVLAKFGKCMDFAEVFSDREIREIESLTMGLDEVKDVSKLASLLTFPQRAQPH